MSPTPFAERSRAKAAQLVAQADACAQVQAEVNSIIGALPMDTEHPKFDVLINLEQAEQGLRLMAERLHVVADASDGKK